MFSPPHSAVVPHGAIAEIVRWIGERATGTCGTRANLPPRREQQLGGIRESIVQLDGLFGIVSEPQHETNAPAILLPNAGATHHAGPNRLYVFLARALSRAGFRCIRFDLSGLGDSIIENPEQENDAYVPAATSIISTVIQAMPQPSYIVA